MTNADAEVFILEIEQSKYHPTEWESDFLESIKERLEDDEYDPLSEKQCDCLERIHDKAMRVNQMKGTYENESR